MTASHQNTSANTSHCPALVQGGLNSPPALRGVSSLLELPPGSFAASAGFLARG